MKAKITYIKWLVIAIAAFSLTACFFNLKTDKEQEVDMNPTYASKQISQKISNIDAIFYFKKALASYGREQADSAIYFYKKSLLYEENPITFGQIGIVESNREHFSLAIRYFDKSIKKDATYWPAYINKSISLYLLKQVDASEQLLNDMVAQCDSKYFVAYANLYLASIYADKGDCAKAKDCLAKMQDLYEDESLHRDLWEIEDKIRNSCKESL